MTATISAAPAQLVDGSWLNGRRGRLVDLALAAAERAMPGISSRVLAFKTIVGPDIEAALGITDNLVRISV